MVGGTLALLCHVHVSTLKLSGAADPKGMKSCRTQRESVCPSIHLSAFGRPVSDSDIAGPGTERSGPDSDIAEPCSERFGPGSVRPVPGSVRPGPGSVRLGPGSVRPEPGFVRL